MDCTRLSKPKIEPNVNHDKLENLHIVKEEFSENKVKSEVIDFNKDENLEKIAEHEKYKFYVKVEDLNPDQSGDISESLKSEELIIKNEEDDFGACQMLRSSSINGFGIDTIRQFQERVSEKLDKGQSMNSNYLRCINRTTDIYEQNRCKPLGQHGDEEVFKCQYGHFVKVDEDKLRKFCRSSAFGTETTQCNQTEEINQKREDPIERKRRLARDRQAQWRARQSPDSRRVAIDRIRESQRNRRETSEETLARKKARGESERRRIQRETPEQTQARRKANAECHRRRRQKETLEETRARREVNAAYQRQRRIQIQAREKLYE